MGPTPIHFYSRKEQPYGVFSNFSAHAIWIGGQRYKTVEHWYQSSKANDEDGRAWIRSAESPEEAKRRGRAVVRRPNWDGEKVAVMYRGVLAKFRQHPDLGRLLASTGPAPIHEAAADGFWGVLDSGEDWLGRILVSIRAQLSFLGALVDGPVMQQLCGTPLLRFQMAAAVRQIQWGGEAWLVHLFRERDGREAAHHLADVLESQCLAGASQANGRRALCFTGSRLSALSDRVYGVEATMRRTSGANRYSPFGIAVLFDYAREIGIVPAISAGPDWSDLLPHAVGFATSMYSASGAVDYTFEDEWRYEADLDLREGPLAVVVPSGDRRSLDVRPFWDTSLQTMISQLRSWPA